MKDSEAHSAIVQWLTKTTGIQWIKGQQSGTQPPEPYGMVNLTGTNEVRTHPRGQETITKDGDIYMIMTIEIEWRFSCHVYGDDASSTLRLAQAATHIIQGDGALPPALITHETSQIRDLPDYINEAWQKHAQMDLIVRGLTHSQPIAIDVVETFKFNLGRQK